jgi:hypothetical protein
LCLLMSGMEFDSSRDTFLQSSYYSEVSYGNSEKNKQ